MNDSSTYYIAGGLEEVDPGTSTTRTLREYTGQQRDDTGLLFYNARYYDPVLARFVSPDTIVPGMSGNVTGADDGNLTPLTVDLHEVDVVHRMSEENGLVLSKGFLQAETRHSAPADPQALNRYSYAANNPLNYTDPTGHDWEDFKEYIIGVFEGMGASGAELANLFKGETWRDFAKGLNLLINDPKAAAKILNMELVAPALRGALLLWNDPGAALSILRSNPRELGRIFGEAFATATIGGAYTYGTEISIGKN